MIQISPEDLRFRVWTEEEFLAREDDFRDLLGRSGADPLFMSWEWLTTWWKLHKEPFGLGLRAFSVESEDGKVLGLAPMTVREFRHRGGIVGTRLEPLGNLHRTRDAALTEYVSFLVDRLGGAELTRRLAGFVLSDPDWDDLCLSFIPTEGDTWRCLAETEGRPASVYARPSDRLSARRIDLKDGFTAFLDRLGAKTRLKVYNARKRLAELGSVQFVSADSDNFEACIEVLNQLHRERWGEPALSGLRGRLYRNLAERSLADGSLSLSHLTVGGEPLAAALNLRKEGCEYGIQMGLSSKAPKNVSVGYLHLGFMIERCCEDGIHHFDFLAGEEGPGDYRRHFPAHVLTVGSVQLVRSRALMALYRSVDLFRRVPDLLRERAGARHGPGEDPAAE